MSTRRPGALAASASRLAAQLDLRWERVPWWRQLFDRGPGVLRFRLTPDSQRRLNDYAAESYRKMYGSERHP